LRGADHGIGNTCISAGGIQQRFTGRIFRRDALQPRCWPQRDPSLSRWIHPFGFSQDLNSRQLTRQPIKRSSGVLPMRSKLS